jgi:Tol biopolymer transport system component
VRAVALVGALLLDAILLGGCPLKPTVAPPTTADAPRLVVSERGPSGGRLAIVAENGDTLTSLTTRGEGTVLDVSPAFSPDGRWIAFASSRERTPQELSLWIVAARPQSTPVRITRGDAVDLSPTWTTDGRALVFSSNRDGDLDLWRQALAFEGDGVRAEGEPEHLTDLDGAELSPSVAKDGRIAFSRVAQGDVARSQISIRAPDGAIDDLTQGPADSGAAWTRDGAAIAFTAPNLRSGDAPGVDGDLWLVDAAGGTPTLLVDAPGTDESGAVWSADGRWLFATSVARADSGEAVFSSVVYLDQKAKQPTLRILDDAAGANPRLSVAVAPVGLDVGALAAGPVYADVLVDVIRRARDRAADEPTP